MRSLQAEAIRTARIAVQLTQDQLGNRIGMKGRAIYRWERGAAVPKRRNRAALLAAIAILDERAAESLRAALEQKTPKPAAAESSAPAAASATPQDMALELAALGLADCLDVAPRRTRIALFRMCNQLAQAGLTLDALQTGLERMLHENAPPSLPVPNQGSPYSVAFFRARPGTNGVLLTYIQGATQACADQESPCPKRLPYRRLSTFPSISKATIAMQMRDAPLPTTRWTLKKRIPVRTSGDVKDPPIGMLETNLVCHRGETMAGSFVHSLVLTDHASGWIECVPLIVRDSSTYAA